MFFSPFILAQNTGNEPRPLADTTRSDDDLLGKQAATKVRPMVSLLATESQNTNTASQENLTLELSANSENAVVSSRTPLRDSTDELLHGSSENQLNSGPYVALGVGRVSIDIKSNALDGEQTSTQLTLGMDVNRFMSAEAHITDFGDIETTGTTKISAMDAGVSALWYLGRNRAAFKRQGLTIFGRTGFGRTEFDQTSDAAPINVALEAAEDWHWTLGAGLEYSTHPGFAVRFEGSAYGRQSSHLQLAVLYRFGAFGAWFSDLPIIGGFSTETYGRRAKMSGLSERFSTTADVDGDGIFDREDKCPDTPESIAVGDNGCAIFNGAIDALAFPPGSAELTADARAMLESVAESLLQTPNARARIAAHTDNQGGAEANMRLSGQRAFEVAKFLVQRGIAKKRLEARAYGEIRPIDTNTTAEGRQNNRRVEIDLIAE